jgi:hypothetical protein
MEASQAAIQDASRTSQRTGNNYSRLFAMSTLAQLQDDARTPTEICCHCRCTSVV